MSQPRSRCGAPMREGRACGRPDSHDGRHRSAASIAQRHRYKREWLLANPEYSREQMREWRLAHPEYSREYSREYNGEYRRNGRYAETLARRLERGDRVLDLRDHHQGMTKLKEWLGDPRPAGLELSLVDPWGPNAYLGYAHPNGQRVEYVLSTDPADYVWETHAENKARGHPTQDEALMAELRRRREAEERAA
jgi:hypothetical protein